MIDIHDIRRGSLDAYDAEWRRPVLDFEPGQSATPGPITRYACETTRGERDYWCRSIGGEYDQERELQWCGLGPSWVLSHTLGHHILERQCVDVRLHPVIAYHLLPGTDRMYDRGRWDKYDIAFPEQPTPADIIPTDIITVGDGVDGSHFTIAISEVDADGRFRTLEFNGKGLLGNGRYGEGVIKRLPTKARGYDGRIHPIEPRHVDEICQTYRFNLTDHYIGAAVSRANS
jgi:hypothetical protein